MEYPEAASTIEKRMISHAAVSQRPVNGSIELLPLCNMNCDMCYVRLDRAQMERLGRIRTADEWICLAREMEKAGVLFLLLTGGEPLLFPDFQKLYLELKRIGMILTINTNGTLLGEEWADFFGKYKPRRINITLYGADDRAYETLCHYPGGFRKTVQAVRLLRERNVDVKLNGSVTRENYGDMKKIYRIAEEVGVPIHMDTYMLPGIRERSLPFERQSRLEPELAARARVEALREEMHPEAFRSYTAQTLRQMDREKAVYPGQISCMAGNCSFAINWKGQIRPCLTLEEPTISVFEHGFEEAWGQISEGAKKFCLNEKCTHCRLRPVCQVCVSSAVLETGSYEKVPEYLCRYARESERLLREEWRKFGNGPDV